jgi:hypothetical protein
LWRQANAESCALSFFAVLAVGGVWAALAHLGKLEAPASLDWITPISAFSLVASIVAGARRGLLRT